MAIEFRCPDGHKLKVPERLAGKTVRCPKCSARAVVPLSERAVTAELDTAELDTERDSVEPLAPRVAPVAAAAGPRSPGAAAPAKPPGQPAGVRPADQSGAGASPRSPYVGLFLIAGSVGAAVVVLIAVAVFVGWKLASAKNAAPEVVEKPAVAPAHAAESVPTAARLVRPAAKTPAEPVAKADAAEKENTAPAETESTATPASERPQQTVDLPAPMQQLVVGGSGKFLVAALPNVKQVAVIDVAAKKIARTVPVDDADCLIAAGETRFVVLQRGQGTIGRYNLETGERESTQSCEAYTALAMGSSSEGPIFAAGPKTALDRPQDARGQRGARGRAVLGDARALAQRGGQQPGLHQHEHHGQSTGDRRVRS